MKAKNSIVGTWKGTIKLSLLPARLRTNVTFTADNQYKIRAKGVESKGQYLIRENILHVIPDTPKGIKPATLFFSIQENALHIWGFTAGIKGDLKASRIEKKA